MFEFDQYQSSRGGPRSAPATAYRPFANFSERAVLQWGEHCVECAAPACFKTCDLYDKRPDQRCRRFAYGIFKNEKYASAYGYGAEVVFKRWGKIEARANAYLFPKRTATRFEVLLGALTALGNPIGTVLSRVSTDVRWSYVSFGLRERLNRWLHKRNARRHWPDAFIIEVYNPTNAVADLSLTISVDRTAIRSHLRADQLPAPLLRSLRFDPGYNLVEIPASDFAAILGSGLPFGIALTPASIEDTHLVFLCLDLVRYADQPSPARVSGEPATPAAIPVANKRPAAKCVVFDLDHTLWNGVLVEGEVHLHPSIRELFAQLDQRGILLSVASKNNYSDAWSKLEELGLSEYLLFPQINWNPKSGNIGKIKNDLDIGIDTFIFIDDNPFEREQVSSAHPGVEVLPETTISTLLDHPRLKGAPTAEARRRRSMYKQAQVREADQVTFDGDYTEFLRNCSIVLKIFDVEASVADRISELVQRTNQLNFSGRKYSRNDFQAVLIDKSVRKTALSCRDKYGDYGVIGACIWSSDGSTVHVHDLMISCRVQGRFIEQALFHELAQLATVGQERITLNFKKTDRNGLAQAVLEKIGFRLDLHGFMEYRFDWGDLSTDFIEVQARSSALQAVP